MTETELNIRYTMGMKTALTPISLALINSKASVELPRVNMNTIPRKA